MKSNSYDVIRLTLLPTDGVTGVCLHSETRKHAREALPCYLDLNLCGYFWFNKPFIKATITKVLLLI